MTDYAHEIKRAITMRRVCEQYGIEVNRANKACCPFHSDRKPSLQIYDGDRGYWCYVCNDGGDVIEFTKRYFNLSFKDALSKLNRDFGLNYPLGAPPDAQTRKEIAHRKQVLDNRRRFEAWKSNVIAELSDCLYLAHSALQHINPDNWKREMIQAIKLRPEIEYYTDVLLGENLKEQINIFRIRKEVNDVCKTILSSIQTK